VPRHTGETLARSNGARSNGLQVLPCPVRIESFTVKQHWHARTHHDPTRSRLRGVCVRLFQSSRKSGL
jgi:hypothetical protein